MEIGQLTFGRPYRAATQYRQRAVVLSLVFAVHAFLVAALLLQKFSVAEAPPPAIIDTFDIAAVEPPPQIVEAVETSQKASPIDRASPSPSSVMRAPSPIVLPKTAIELPPVNPVVVSPVAGLGNDGAVGQADGPAPGIGDGGEGEGSGTGGKGGALIGGAGTRPEFIQRSAIRSWHLSRSSRRNWPKGGRVMVVVNVQTNGRATDCEVRVSIGNPEIDAEICHLVERKARFRPARDAEGRPYVKPFGYIQYAPSR